MLHRGDHQQRGMKPSHLVSTVVVCGLKVLLFVYYIVVRYSVLCCLKIGPVPLRLSSDAEQNRRRLSHHVISFVDNDWRTCISVRIDQMHQVCTDRIILDEAYRVE